VIPEPVNSFDIMATILELARINIAHVQFAKSLLPQLMGRPNPDVHPYVFSEGGYTAGSNEVEPLDPAQAKDYADPTSLYYPRGQEELKAPPDCSRFIMMRNASHKLVYRPSGVGELYDMQADPRELTNLYNNPTYAALQVGALGSSSEQCPLNNAMCELQATMTTDLLNWLVATSDVTPIVDDDRNSPPSPPYPYGPWPPKAVS
jgi:choline-sulfatase